VKAVLFDFDFTLADASRGIIACVHHAFDAMGLDRPTDDAIRRTIGLPLPDTFSRLTGVDDTAERERFRILYLGQARQIMADLTEIIAGVREGLRALSAGGVRMGIVSTKIRENIRKPLEREALASLFDVVIGGDDVVRAKPHPEGVLAALKTMGVSAGECLYVGDSVLDVETARNADLGFAGILTGTTGRDELERAGARVIVERLDQLRVDDGLWRRARST
jgi:phosphoglycolate phosphatase